MSPGMRSEPLRSNPRRGSGAVAVLRAVHSRPGIERATVVRELGLTSGFAAETMARLGGLKLLEERPAPLSGGRGRPTTTLHPHPGGPLVVAAAIAHEEWEVATVEIGGTVTSSVRRPHGRHAGEVLAAVGAELRLVRRRHGARIRAVAVAVPGTVSGSRLALAPNLGWHDVDLSTLWPDDRSGRAWLPGNDATFAAVAEARRGRSAGAPSTLHLYMDAGIGGAVIEDGRTLSGANGMAGEFGHLPFGPPSVRCRCGAWGCWNTAVDGAALAAALGAPAPVDEVSFSRSVIAAARQGRGPELAAVEAVGRCVGRGAAGLVNAFDPAIVTLGGVGRDLLAVAGGGVQAAYLSGLMQFRPTPPPPLVEARLGAEAPLVGAAEDAFAAVLTDAGLRAWSERAR
jgi:predicted NBD/HSP70 family sugar kinase